MRSVMMNLFVQPLGRNLRFFHSVRIQTIQSLALMSCPRNKHIFRCDQNGPPATREEGAYLERYVTDAQRSRRPIFIATPGPRLVGCFSALLASHVSIQICSSLTP